RPHLEVLLHYHVGESDCLETVHRPATREGRQGPVCRQFDAEAFHILTHRARQTADRAAHEQQEPRPTQVAPIASPDLVGTQHNPGFNRVAVTTHRDNAERTAFLESIGEELRSGWRLVTGSIPGQPIRLRELRLDVVEPGGTSPRDIVRLEV